MPDAVKLEKCPFEDSAWVKYCAYCKEAGIWPDIERFDSWRRRQKL